MAARLKQRKRCGNESGSKTFFPSLSHVSVGVMAVVMMAVMTAWMGGMGVDAAPTTTERMVVSKSRISGPCVDASGSVVGDLAEWSTGCNKIVCHVEPSGNYTITHQCRGLVPSENPDDVNCYTAMNSTATYPDCCPFLQCGSAAGVSTVNPSLCTDLSDFGTCQIWKELSNNCTDTTKMVYNFTLTYCRATCGHCPTSTG